MAYIYIVTWTFDGEIKCEAFKHEVDAERFVEACKHSGRRNLQITRRWLFS